MNKSETKGMATSSIMGDFHTGVTQCTINKHHIATLEVSGYKSFAQRPVQTLPLSDVNVFLGANGAGKSNLLSCFSWFDHQCEHATNGIAARLLFNGSVEQTTSAYVKLVATNGTKASVLFRYAQGQLNHEFIGQSPQTRVFQFNNTSPNSRIRASVNKYDCHSLHGHGGNLAAYLLYIKNEHPSRYSLIRRQIRRILPQFDDFALETDMDKSIAILNWSDKSFPGVLFSPQQLSDGSLRFMCLAALLLSPKTLLPDVIVVDEPELGLHPTALQYLHGMIKMASAHSQIVIATQSEFLVNLFSPNEVAVVEQSGPNGYTVVKHLNQNALRDWIADYSLAELWEKNVLGGKP